MKFVCERCHTKYSIADEKVRGKVLKVRCKTCTNVITVRETGASVEDAPTAIDAGHAHSAATAHAEVDVKAAFTAAPGGSRAPAGGAPPVRSGAAAAAAAAVGAKPPAANGTAARLTRGAIASAATGSAAGGTGAQLSPSVVTPRRPTGAIPIPPPLPQNDIEWYLAVDGVQTGPFGRSILVERILTQPKTADVHVWNADLDGWKPPRDLPELAQEMVRRRRSLTPVPPPPPRRLFPTGPHPATESQVAAAPAAPAAPAVEARSTAPGARPGAPANTGLGAGKNGATNGASNGVHAAGFAVDQLVGGDASAAISAAALPALLSSAVPTQAGVPAVNSSAIGLSVPVLNGPAALIAKVKLRSTRVLLAGGAAVAMVVCALIAFAVLRHPAAPPPAATAVKVDPDQATAPSAPGTTAEHTAKDEASTAKVSPEEPAAPAVPADSKVPVAARIEAAAPRPGRRAKRGARSQPTSTVPPPVASGMTADQRDAAGRFGDSSGRELRIPGTSSSGARSTPVQADISRVINNNRQGIQTCYQRALLRDNSLTNGKITVRVTVGLSGRVQRVNLDATAPFRALEPCIRDVMSRWAFPPSSEEYQTEFPVVLAGNQ